MSYERCSKCGREVHVNRRSSEPRPVEFACLDCFLTGEQNTAYVRAALAYDATYLDGSTLIAPGITLAEALAEPERVVRPVWEAALHVTRIPWSGADDFDGLARVANISMLRGGVEPSTLASIGLRVLRVMAQRESKK